jgi:acyl carrier protein
MKREEISKIVLSVFGEILIDRDDIDQYEINEKTQLMGSNSLLDSIDLVTFIVSLEQYLEDEFSITITIADENAMSQKESPFKTLGTLVDFIQGKVN